MAIDEKEINQDTIKHVAEIARLKLSEKESREFTRDFKEVLDAFSKIKEANTEGVEASFQPVELKNVMREDEAGECLDQDDALSLSPHKKNGYFKGPKVVE